MPKKDHNLRLAVGSISAGSLEHTREVSKVRLHSNSRADGCSDVDKMNPSSDDHNTVGVSI